VSPFLLRLSCSLVKSGGRIAYDALTRQRQF
jgi:hypothetical protein